MIVCNVCKKDFSSKDIYLGGKLIAKYEEFGSPKLPYDTQDLCGGCLFKVLNFIGQLKNNKKVN